MALSPKKRATTIILDAEMSRLLAIAAKKRGTSRSAFIRNQLARALEQFREHPKPRSAGAVKRRLREHGKESELFRDLEQ